MVHKQVGVVFVHGLFSSPQTWSSFTELIGQDEELAGMTPLLFGYSSPVAVLSPLRRIPSFDDLADSLQTFLEVEAHPFEQLVLVSHSQGGLIVQRHLARMLGAGRGTELARIRQIVMFACPNSGSELALTLRRALWRGRNGQERQLRPVNAAVTEAQRTVFNRVVHARAVTASSCPIPIKAYAGETDNVVTPASARSVFPHADVGVLPGDHFTIIRPDSSAHRSYAALKQLLLTSRRAAEAQPTGREVGILGRETESPGREVVATAVAETVDGRLAAIDTDDLPQGGIEATVRAGHVGPDGEVTGVRIRRRTPPTEAS
ncbi:alpha/beta hydrolase family protein [Streptomyces sp. E11-3]|uniref:esterase/lipase family protein n=1 Tax=Streptomyces sp. E11-3 TaxID=3110112 RepID=UPI00397F1222